MSDVIIEPRRFRVRARHQDLHHAAVITEASFEAAALAYAERLPHAPGQDTELGIIVHEIATGHEHAFFVHLDDAAVRHD